MTYVLPPLTWLRAFEASARHLSFAAAASELALTPAAISQQIRALEGHLGFALFERLARGVRLTDIGRAYLPSVRRAFDEISLSTQGLFGSGGVRGITVRAPISFALLCLAPRLPGFRAAHPGVPLRLCTAVWADALDDSEVDVDIRYGDGRWDLPGDLLSRGASIPVCAPGYAGGCDLAGLVARGVIHIMGCEDLWAKLLREQGFSDEVPSGISADTSLIALELAAAGQGCALVLEDFAAGYLASGRLVRAAPVALPATQGHYVLLPRLRPAGVADALVLRDWLKAEFPGI